MGIIVALLGKSASGKDTMLSKLISGLGFFRVLPVTTRPMRPGEENGRDYEFVSREEFEEMDRSGRFIESREYNTLFDGKPDVWYYATARDSIDLEKGNYTAIVDLAALRAIRSEFGSSVVAVFLDVPETVRKKRCFSRGGFSLEEWERREADDRMKYTPEAISGNIDLLLTSTETDVSFGELERYLKGTGRIE